MRILIGWHWSTGIVQVPNVVVSIWHTGVHACKSFNVPEGRTVEGRITSICMSTARPCLGAAEWGTR